MSPIWRLCMALSQELFCVLVTETLVTFKYDRVCGLSCVVLKTEVCCLYWMAHSRPRGPEVTLKRLTTERGDKARPLPRRPPVRSPLLRSRMTSEFSVIFLSAVYIHPQADASSALNDLSDNIHKYEASHPNTVIIVAYVVLNLLSLTTISMLNILPENHEP